MDRLDNAIRTHLNWRIKFEASILIQQQLDVDKISSNNHCEVGRWFNSVKVNNHGIDSSLIEEGARLHDEFHREAGKIATLINQRKFHDATLAVRGGRYVSTSNDLCAAITKILKNVVEL